MFSTWIGVVLLFAFFGLLAMVIVRASPRGDSYEAKRAKARAEKLEAAQKENMSALTTYAWVDKTKGVARIPIEKAMQLSMAELAQKKPAPANPIAAPETSPAAPATSPAGSPTPAPTAAASPAASGTPKPTSVSGVHSESHNQPAAAANPPAAPPNTQPGPSATPGGSPPSAAAKAPVSPTASPTPAAPGTPLPVRGKTP